MSRKRFSFARGYILVALGLMTAPAFAEVSVIRNGSETILMSADASLIEAEAVLYEPGYSWVGGKTGVQATGSGAVCTVVPKLRKQAGTWEWTEALNAKNKQLTIEVTTRSDKDLSLTYGALGFSAGKAMRGGTAEVFLADGTSQQFPLPFPKAALTGVQKVVFTKEGQPAVTLMVKPPLDAHVDGNIRLKVLGESLPANDLVDAQFTLATSEDMRFYASTTELPDPVDLSTWFAFNPQNSTEPGVLGMNKWMHGIPKKFLEIDGDRIVADGKPFKAWGSNVEYASTAPKKDEAEQRAAWFAKWGVNVIRLHKLTNPGWEGLGSTESASVYDEEKLARFDYFTSQLRDNGILYGLSPIWRLKIFPGDKDKLIAYDEMVEKGGQKVTTGGLVWFMEDVQDLHIETMLNLLNHENPHTGLRYAEDTAVAYVEIQNEEDAFFFTVMPNMLKYPTYKRLIAEKFSDWLKERYGSEEKLVAAWGSGGLNGFEKEGAYPDESLAQRNILPMASPWFLDERGAYGPLAARLQDTADFLLECQNHYYQRMEKAIRDAGYKGPLIGSNWQAGEKTGHFYNLYSDASIGIIDRHNYLVGANGIPKHEIKTGHPFVNVASLDDPGGTLLSSGMQQVDDRPFSLSEWLAIPPQEWAASETAIIAVYGMGLQGWDMSYHFASNDDGFTPTVNAGNKKFNNQTAHGIGMFPVLSRMVLRNDIAEGDVIARRTLTLEQARNQTYDFENKSVQEHDLKSFDGTPGRNTLAIGRVVVDFVDEPIPSELKPLGPYKEGDTLKSTTGQLSWTASGEPKTGYFTVNSPGTQGVVGFAPKTAEAFDDVTVEPQNDYSVILATALEPDRTLADCDEALVLALSRVRNSGMKLVNGFIADRGSAPTIIEPVQTKLTFNRQPKEVIALDQDGMPTAEKLRLNGKAVSIDTGKYETFYYLVRF